MLPVKDLEKVTVRIPKTSDNQYVLEEQNYANKF